MSSDSVPSRLDSGTDSIVVRDGGDVKRSASCARFSDDSGGGRVQALLQARRISVSYGLPEGRVTLLASRQVGILESLRHLEETLAAAGVPPSP